MIRGGGLEPSATTAPLRALLCASPVDKNFVFLGQTKLPYIYPLGSQEYGELFILLFPNLQ